MRSVHTINLICRAERLSESNYGVMQQKDEGVAGGGGGGQNREDKFYSLPAYVPYVHAHNTRMRRHVPLWFAPAHGVARRPFTNIPAGIRTADSP